MFTFTINLSNDRATAELTLPDTKLRLTAGEMSDLIQHLAWVRASMLPAHEPVDLAPETTVSNVPAIRWQATEDTIPGQTRLYLLHPGFGWLHIPLDRTAFDRMSAAARLFLQERFSIQ